MFAYRYCNVILSIRIASFYHLIAAADSNHDPRLCRFLKKNFSSSFLFLHKFPVFQQDDVIGYFENEHHECNFTTMFKSFSIFLSSTCPRAFFYFSNCFYEVRVNVRILQVNSFI